MQPQTKQPKMKKVKIVETAKYDDNLLVIGYYLTKYELDKDGIYKATDKKEVLF
jgi:hypothetical protein